MVGLFVDIARQYETLLSHYYELNTRINPITREEIAFAKPTARINYERYLKEALKYSQGKKLHRAFAYGVQINTEATSFATAMTHLGYEPKYKQARTSYDPDTDTVRPSIKATSWTMGIAMDIVRQVNAKFVTEVVIGSNDHELADALYWAKEQGVKVTVFSLSVGPELRHAADRTIEIGEHVIDLYDDLVRDKVQA
jgi:uncharacterized LabA/DUF88 family protein